MKLINRRWDLWISRMRQKSGTSSTVSGILGLGVAIFGSTIDATILTFGGATAFLFVLLYPPLAAFPPRIRSLKEIEGRQLAFSMIDSVDQKVCRVALVGPGSVGKTTLLEYLIDKKPEFPRTEELYGMAATIQGPDETSILLLDASGQQFVQQFTLIEKANVVVVMIDHNEAENETVISADRLTGNLNFLKQIVFYCRERGISKPHNVIFLFNKRDLWEKAGNANVFSEKCEAAAIEWKTRGITNGVRCLPFSNYNTQDIMTLKSHLRDVCKSGN